MNIPTIDIKQTGLRIRELQLSNHLTITAVKDALGLAAVQSVYHWYWGHSLPSIDNLVGLSYLFDVSIDDILVLKCSQENK